MTRAAIYARMSTDKQNERSPADQVRECRRFAERQGYKVVPALVFEEAGISGASRHNRPRLLELVARIDEWDVLLAFRLLAAGSQPGGSRLDREPPPAPPAASLRGEHGPRSPQHRRARDGRRERGVSSEARGGHAARATGPGRERTPRCRAPVRLQDRGRRGRRPLRTPARRGRGARRTREANLQPLLEGLR